MAEGKRKFIAEMTDAVAFAAILGAIVAIVATMAWVAVTILTQPIGHVIVAVGIFAAGYMVGAGVSRWTKN